MQVFVIVLSFVSAALAGYIQPTPTSLKHINTGSYGGTIGGYTPVNSVHSGYVSNWVPGTSSGAVHTSGVVGNYAGGLSGHSTGSGGGHTQTYSAGYSSGNNYPAHTVSAALSVNSGQYRPTNYANNHGSNVGYSGYTGGQGQTSGANQNYAKFNSFTNNPGYVSLSAYKVAAPPVQNYNSAGSPGHTYYVNEDADQVASIGAYAAGQGFVATHLPGIHTNNVGGSAGYQYPSPNQQTHSVGSYNHGNATPHVVGQSIGSSHGYAAQVNNGLASTGHQYQPTNQQSYSSGSYHKGNYAAHSVPTHVHGAAVPEGYASG